MFKSLNVSILTNSSPKLATPITLERCLVRNIDLTLGRCDFAVASSFNVATNKTGNSFPSSIRWWKTSSSESKVLLIMAVFLQIA